MRVDLMGVEGSYPSDLVPHGTLGHVITAVLKHEANGQCRSS